MPHDEIAIFRANGTEYPDLLVTMPSGVKYEFLDATVPAESTIETYLIVAFERHQIIDGLWTGAYIIEDPIYLPIAHK